MGASSETPPQTDFGSPFSNWLSAGALVSCCGNSASGGPAVPVEWLKKEERAKGLLKHIDFQSEVLWDPAMSRMSSRFQTRREPDRWGRSLSSINIERRSNGPFHQRMQESCLLFPNNSANTFCIRFLTRMSRKSEIPRRRNLVAASFEFGESS